MNEHVEQLEEMFGLDEYKELWTEVTSLPWKKGLTVKGDLNLCETKITKLPDNLEVGGYLDILGTQITEIPDNLKVGGDLYLGGTLITDLPDNFKVGGNLYLYGTEITNLPDNLEVTGEIYVTKHMPPSWVHYLRKKSIYE